MINMQPVSFLRKFNIQNNYKKNQTSPLAPLKQDTVSFSGARNLNHSLQDAFENKEICEEISKNAKPAKDNLEKSLTRALQGLIVSQQNPNGIIEPISARVKEATSVREKATSKFEEAIITHDLTNFINLNESEDIKKTVGDLVGARIIVNQSNPKKNAAIIDSLISLVEKGELKIKKIEIIAPSENGLEPYFNDDDLERLKNAVNAKRGYYAEKIDIDRHPSESGYSAIHIDLDLSDENMIAKHNGYKGELQIIGSDVAYFKDLEDYCYKIKQDKDIKSGHPAYNMLVQHLNKYFKYCEAGKTKEQNDAVSESYKTTFNEYTRRAYIFQRRKNQSDSGYDKFHLPSLEDCGMEKLLPKDLDFNYLQRIRILCDTLYELYDKKKISPNIDVELLQRYSCIVNDALRGTDSKTSKQIKKLYDNLYESYSSGKIRGIVDYDLVQMHSFMLNDLLKNTDAKTSKQVKSILDQLYSLTTPKDFEP